MLSKKNPNMRILETSISFYDCFTENIKTSSMEKTLSNLWCGYYNEQEEYREAHLFIKLNEFMRQNYLIFVFLDFYDYLLEETETDGTNHEKATHSTALILYKDTEGKYRAFHFNPYGQYGLKVNYYEYYISRKREKTIDLDTSLDIFMVDMLIKTYNTTMYWYYNTFIHIEYKPNPEYNYIGPNLQKGDYYGICYIYPFIVCYELCCNFMERSTINTNLKKRTFSSYSRLFGRNCINEAILIMMSKYFKALRTEILSGPLNPNILTISVENNLKLVNTTYIKFILSQVTQFLLQPEFKKTAGKL